jgi:hypothetical protein
MRVRSEIRLERRFECSVLELYAYYLVMNSKAVYRMLMPTALFSYSILTSIPDI